MLTSLRVLKLRGAALTAPAALLHLRHLTRLTSLSLCHDVPFTWEDDEEGMMDLPAGSGAVGDKFKFECSMEGSQVRLLGPLSLASSKH